MQLSLLNHKYYQSVVETVTANGKYNLNSLSVVEIIRNIIIKTNSNVLCDRMGWFIFISLWILFSLIFSRIFHVFRLYLKLIIKRNSSFVCLVGKTAIVTGANTGIGYITALDFAKRGAKVILACRNQAKAEEARKKIVNETVNPNVVYKLVNLSSFESVRAFAKDINETEERIDILVNNAGGAGLCNHITDDGVQLTLQINHLSPFLLTNLLIDKIKKSAPSRIVNVSSTSANWSRLELDKINIFPSDCNRAWADQLMYANSKLCNILFTIELAKKLSNTRVTTNALHPGAIRTEIFRRIPVILKKVQVVISTLFFMSPTEGAETTIYVATSEKLKHITGKLFDNCQEISL